MKKFILGGIAAIVGLLIIGQLVSGRISPHVSATIPQAKTAYTGPTFEFSETEAVTRMAKGDPDITKAEVVKSIDSDGADCSVRKTGLATVTICSFQDKVQRVSYQVWGNGNIKAKAWSIIPADAYMALLAPKEGYSNNDRDRIRREVLGNLGNKSDSWVAIDQWFVFVNSQGKWSYTISLSPANQPWTKQKDDQNKSENVRDVER